METRIATQNPTWGFFGTLMHAGVANAAALFEAAARELMARITLNEDEARFVLDASIGRHMADQYEDGESAVTLVARLIERGWTRDLLWAAGSRGNAPKEIVLPVKPDELAVLRYALDHAMSSTSEAHLKDRAQLVALIERLEAAGGRP